MKSLKKKDSIPSNRKRRLLQKFLRKKRRIYNIIYSPKNTSQYLIKVHKHFKNNDIDEEDYIPYNSMNNCFNILNCFNIQSENSTCDEEEENNFNC